MARGKRANNPTDRVDKQKQQRSVEPSDDRDAPVEPVEDKMKIFFRVMKTIPLEVKKSDTMQKIGTEFSDMQGISMVSLKSLFFAGDRLDIKEKKVGDYDITDGSIISVYLDSGNRIQIHVKMSQLKKNITLDVDMRDTILSVKQRIQNKEGVSISHQDLVYLGEELDDGRTLASYPLVTAGSTIYALVRQGDGMKISVRNEQNGSVIALKVKGWYSVENIKIMIESMVGIPIENQRLSVGRLKLENDRTLTDLNILSGQMFNVLSGMRLRVKTQVGKTLTFVVNESDTLYMIKKLIEEKEGMHVDDQALIFNGRRLQNGRTLASYEIQDNDEVDFMLLQRGC